MRIGAFVGGKASQMLYHIPSEFTKEGNEVH